MRVNSVSISPEEYMIHDILLYITSRAPSFSVLVTAVIK